MIKSLKARENELSESQRQIEILTNVGETPFSHKLKELGHWPLKSQQLEILQINVGYMCNQTCEHCHVD
ncbi:MAG: radical SAM protein, partial [Flavobacteriales bacterium]|nr:radical SAM protein [Flavobacteriales bacterium]